MLRTKVGAGTGVRFTPTLTFTRDTTTDTVQRMDELLARARAADADVARVRAGAKPAGEADPYRDGGSAAEPAVGALNGLDAWRRQPVTTIDPKTELAEPRSPGHASTPSALPNCSRRQRRSR